MKKKRKNVFKKNETEKWSTLFIEVERNKTKKKSKETQK